jgi:glucokinase
LEPLVELDKGENRFRIKLTIINLYHVNLFSRTIHMAPNTFEAYLEVASIIRNQQPISRAEIARLLDMSPSTVGRVVDLLINIRLIREGEQRYPAGGGAGRPSIPLEFNAQFSAVLTVDLRLTEAYAAITDLAGNILASQIQPLTLNDSSRSLEELISLIHNLCESNPCSLPVQTIVIGAPSIVDVGAGVIEWAPSLSWNDIPIKKILEDEFRVSAMVENDVNLAALGEFWKGAGRSVHKNMVFVSVGTGIGAGIIINSQLYRGATHAAGEVGYFLTDVNVLRDNVGKIGNLESRVGREGLTRTAQLVAQRYPASKLAELFSRDGNRVQTRDILALAEEEDQAALVVYNELVNILTIVICNISVMLDPEMIVLGGPGDWKWTRIIPSIQKLIGTSLLRPVNLKPSELGKNALIVGGAYSALPLLPVYNIKNSSS